MVMFSKAQYDTYVRMIYEDNIFHTFAQKSGKFRDRIIEWRVEICVFIKQLEIISTRIISGKKFTHLSFEVALGLKIFCSNLKCSSVCEEEKPYSS